MQLTKELVKEIKSAKTLVVRRDRKGAGMMTLHFEDHIRGKKVESSKHYLIKVNLTGYKIKDYDDITDGQARVLLSAPMGDEYCVSVCDLYAHTVEASAIAMLSAGDELEFNFVANKHGNSHMGKAKLYIDTLQMEVKRETKGKSRLVFELDTVINPGNSARMIGGAGCSDIDPCSYDLENRLETNNHMNNA